jgi:beta-lactamase regulating signal transducer with metallopeptidase domain
MSILSLYSGSIIIGEGLINCVVEGTLLALLVSVLFQLKAFRDSATRFAIWLVTLLAILVFPFLGSTGASKFVVTSAPHLSVSAAWLDFALAGWAMISLFGILRIFVGVTHLRRLRRRAPEVQVGDLPVEARSVLEEFSSRRDVRICVSDEINAPTAVGFIRPAVLMPDWTLSELTGEKLRSVLLHELGHLRRWDDWTNLLQKILRAIFFFHPAVWWIDSRLCLEREMACDDLVLAETNDARGYAECLVSLAEKSMVRRGIALAVAAVGRVRQMTLRLGRILDQNSRGAVSRLAVAGLSVFGILVIAVSAHLPAMVILQEPAPSSSVLAKAGDIVVSPEVKVDLTSASASHLPARVIPAAMNISSVSGRSAVNLTRAKEIKAAQRQTRTATKARVIQASLKTGNNMGKTLEPTLLLVIGTARPEWLQIPEMVFAEPFAATLVCESGSSASCTATSTGIVQFTIYRHSGADRSEFVANVI